MSQSGKLCHKNEVRQVQVKGRKGTSDMLYQIFDVFLGPLPGCICFYASVYSMATHIIGS